MMKLTPMAGAILLALSALDAQAQAADAPASTAAQQPAPAAPGTPKAGEEAKAPAAQQPADRPAAQRPAQAAPAQGKAEPQTVTITGAQNEVDKRSQQTASKLIIGREELDRQGDSNVAEVLKRLPGVTVGGVPGRGGNIRMRGMGAGFTQILINGERPPPGFSLENINPDQVERIEVMRAPTAEFSTQAIAGTINVILREGVQLKQTQLALADTIEDGMHGPSVSITHPGQLGPNVSYVFTGAIQQNRGGNDNISFTSGTDANGVPDLQRTVISTGERQNRGIHLAPRFNIKLGSDTLTLQTFAGTHRGEAESRADLVQTLGVAPYAASVSQNENKATFGRVMANYQTRFANNARLNVRGSFGGGRVDVDSWQRLTDAGGGLRNLITSDMQIRDNGFNTGGKYSTAVMDGHAFAFGWDVDYNRRKQTRVALDNGVPQFDDSGENLDARTRRLALFAQDEWDITKEVSVYFGLRWEGVNTKSSTPSVKVDNNTSVFSPVLHGVWRIPGKEKDQVRASITHAYRAPNTGDLLATPFLSAVNTPTTPDHLGNPSLKPELSVGVELGYERYLAAGGVLSINTYVRDIDDMIRRQVIQQDSGSGLRWVSMPRNIGKARTAGVELEAKFQLQQLIDDAPPVEIRANYSRYHSKVDGVPGPDNRIDSQPKQTANLGLDYRMRSIPLTLGGSINWTPAYDTQTSASQSTHTGVKRQTDLYGLWKFDADTQLRVSLTNAVNDDYITGSTVTYGRGAQTVTNRAKTYTSIGLRLEMKI